MIEKILRQKGFYGLAELVKELSMKQGSVPKIIDYRKLLNEWLLRGGYYNSLYRVLRVFVKLNIAKITKNKEKKEHLLELTEKAIKLFKDYFYLQSVFEGEV